ncbi:GNAT family N-acetyltransferase [Archangium sp.]|uniref:GNAT family N-acetyltransferase n=1 Tax=Archangium sp. TaxID=1872627 RepID=UPI00286A6851|nr:GNAT family N-acetyltransferase [Archangium sp.]
MGTTVRRATRKDAQACGRILYEAFKTISSQHGFSPDFASEQEATMVWFAALAHPGYYGVVAESEGKVVGTILLDERDSVAGMMGLAVDPSATGVGLAAIQLQRHMMSRCKERGVSMRGMVATYHHGGYAMDRRFGFVLRDLILWMEGPPLKREVPGHPVRPATREDIEACNPLCLRAHGVSRGGSLLDGVLSKTALVVEREGRITGYWAQAGIGHAVAETNADLQALICAAPRMVGGSGPLVPADNAELFRWCYDNGFRVIRTMVQVTRDDWKPSALPYLPSTSW